MNGLVIDRVQEIAERRKKRKKKRSTSSLFLSVWELRRDATKAEMETS
tara:strand:- start:342 stop:485 length:144 start_codon:yes stop_codon:yes gene_type:complete